MLNTPIYLSEKAINAMENDTKRVVVEHNEFGELKCGWEATE